MPALLEKSCWTEEFSLLHCEGFRVEGPDGELGYVEEVLLDAENVPEALVVRGTRRIVIPATEILRLLPGSERVLVGKLSL
jgi:hypothetical protein